MLSVERSRVAAQCRLPNPLKPMSPTAVSDIGQIAITVRDVAVSKRFYGEVLGLKPLFDAGPNLSFFAAGTVRIMLTTPDGAGEAGKNSVLFFKTPAIDATYETLIARGATPGTKPRAIAKLPDHELWVGFVKDPDGNMVGLMEERR